MSDLEDQSVLLARALHELGPDELAARIRRLSPLDLHRVRRLVQQAEAAPKSPVPPPPPTAATTAEASRSAWEAEARRARRTNLLVHWAIYLLLATGTVAVACTAGWRWDMGPATDTASR